MFAIAEKVGASSILAIDAFGGSWSIDEATEAFAGFCDRALSAGIHVHLEFLPWSRIPDLATAWQIVQEANRPNAGIALDAFYWYRGNPDAELLTSLPSNAITALILDDAPVSTDRAVLDTAMHARLLPGVGELNLIGLLSTLQTIGVDVPVGVEVLSDSFHLYPPVEAATLAYDATRSVLKRAGWNEVTA
jgi:sugar phosphate isomerase/epimerase